MSAARRILVTGATGVVGRFLVPGLVAQGHEVSAVGRTPEKRAWLDSVGARGVALDLFDGEGARRVLAGAHIEVVINLATHIPPVTRSMLPWAWQENDRIRRDGSATLVDAALESGVGRFVQESFAPMYEDGGNAWIDEGWPVRPVRYNLSTLTAESSAERFTARGGVGVVLRYAGFYGPDPMLRTLLGMVRRGWAPLPGPERAYWSAIAHEDAASATAAALDVPAGCYNVCDDEPLTRRDFGDAAADALGTRPPRPLPRWIAALGGSTMELLSRSQRMSHAKLTAASGWTPRWRSARDGLKAAAAALATPSTP